MTPAHYFDDDPSVRSSPIQVEVNLPDVALQLTSDRGVFSTGHLDAGTKLLLLEAPPLAETDLTVLDLGCGWGPITCVVAKRAPQAHVWAVDVNQRARSLTVANASAIGADDRVTVIAPDDLPPEIRFDRILSNPPIRIGKQALHELLGLWLGRLAPTGVAHLVVQRHLGSDSLAAWLEREGHRVDRLKSRAGYRILEVGPSSGEPRS